MTAGADDDSAWRYSGVAVNQRMLMSHLGQPLSISIRDNKTPNKSDTSLGVSLSQGLSVSR